MCLKNLVVASRRIGSRLMSTMFESKNKIAATRSKYPATGGGEENNEEISDDIVNN